MATMTQPNNERNRSPRLGHLVRRPCVAAFVLGGTAFVLSTCAGPTEVRDPNTGAITLQLSALPSLIVQQKELFTVRAVNASGVEVALPQPVVWTSSEPTVASIASTSATGTSVVTGVSRGTAVITVRSGSASAAMTLSVRARVRIAPDHFPEWRESMPLAVGDSLQFTAHYVDVNGASINETASATWASSNAAAVSVTASGLVVGVQAGSSAVIIASTPDGLDSTRASVSDVIAGLPATIRFAHTASGVDSVRFLPSKGVPVTLSFGESVVRPILSGTFRIEIEGFPAVRPTAYQSKSSWIGMIRADDHLSLYAWGTTAGTWLTQLWARPATIPADSGLVRFVQASRFPVVYLRPPDAQMSGLPELCYFDPGDPTDYFRRAAGDFDIILGGKNLGPELARIRATAPPGRAITYVLIGERTQTPEVLAFPDF